jgi:hypothetical protein
LSNISENILIMVEKEYDLAGNRTQKILTTNQTNHTNQYTLGIGNRLASWGDNGEAHYNAAGCLTNMVSDVDGKELNLSWDNQYKVRSVKLEGRNQEVNYQYNVLGQRVARSEVSAGITNVEYYVHDGARRKLKVKR